MARDKEDNDKIEVIPIRLPRNTPQHIKVSLKEMKEKSKDSKPTFNQKCAAMLIESIELMSSHQVIKVKLPEALTVEEKLWLNEPMTQKFFGNALFQLIKQYGQIEGKPAHFEFSEQPASNVVIVPSHIDILVDDNSQAPKKAVSVEIQKESAIDAQFRKNLLETIFDEG